MGSIYKKIRSHERRRICRTPLLAYIWRVARTGVSAVLMVFSSSIFVVFDNKIGRGHITRNIKNKTKTRRDRI